MPKVEGHPGHCAASTKRISHRLLVHLHWLRVQFLNSSIGPFPRSDAVILTRRLRDEFFQWQKGGVAIRLGKIGDGVALWNDNLVSSFDSWRIRDTMAYRFESVIR